MEIVLQRPGFGFESLLLWDPPPQNFCHSLEFRWAYSYTATSLLMNCAKAKLSLLESSSHCSVVDNH